MATRRYQLGDDQIAGGSAGSLGDLSLGDIQLRGRTVSMFLQEFVTDAYFDRIIMGASTLTLEVEDYNRKLLGSKLVK